MDKFTFEDHFSRFVASPLLETGFSYVGRSKTLSLVEEDRELSFMRLGGKRSSPGEIKTIICFRHIFLRPVQSDNPSATALEPSDYPRKLIFSDLLRYPKAMIKYEPMNLGLRKFDAIEFKDKNETEMNRVLSGLCNTILEKGVAWARTRTPARELEEIVRFGENAWCERRWIDDYQAHVAR